MKILVIGSGGREHAIAWKLAQSPKSSKIYVAPGNGGTANDRAMVNVPITAVDTLVGFARRERIGLTVVGPEAPLAEGVVDAFRAAGLRIFGPTRAAAQLESSKEFAKAFMVRHGIPTARYATFTDAVAAHAYIDEQRTPIVVKADGLAAGKGVVVAQTVEEAHAAVNAMLGSRQCGEAGAKVVVEEFLSGEEASFIAVCDGEHALPMASSQDHKRLLDGDAGPNTGGMGAYSPAPIVTPELHARVLREIIQPVLRGMKQEGMPYTGFLYAGLMIDRPDSPRVLEFNCRLGDPEAQPLLMRLKSDLLQLIEKALEGRLDQIEAEWDRRTALGVVLAAAGYPESPRKGDEIIGLPTDSDECHVFHSGTLRRDGKLLTSGGRVLCVTALGDTVRQAQRRAYEAAEGIRFEGRQMRRDIGQKAIERRHRE
jgi:phosphoribosylamine---glycine ligase